MTVWTRSEMSRCRAFYMCALAATASLAGAWGCGSRTGLEPFGQDESEEGDGSADGECGAPSCAPGGPGMTNCGASHKSAAAQVWK